MMMMMMMSYDDDDPKNSIRWTPLQQDLNAIAGGIIVLSLCYIPRASTD